MLRYKFLLLCAIIGCLLLQLNTVFTYAEASVPNVVSDNETEYQLSAISYSNSVSDEAVSSDSYLISRLDFISTILVLIIILLALIFACNIVSFIFSFFIK